jgi:hypothetical protein
MLDHLSLRVSLEAPQTLEQVPLGIAQQARRHGPWEQLAWLILQRHRHLGLVVGEWRHRDDGALVLVGAQSS